MGYADAISLREYANMSGVSEGYIRKLRDKGKISARAFVVHPGNTRPMILPDIADAEWGSAHKALKGIKNTPRSEKSSKTIILAPVEKQAVNDTGDIELSVDEMVDDEGLPIVRAGMTAFDADRVKKILESMTLKVKLRQTNGELVEKKEVYKDLFLFAQEMRAELQNIPERTIDEIMAAVSRNKGYLILSGEIDKVLEKLATNCETVLK